MSYQLEEVLEMLMQRAESRANNSQSDYGAVLAALNSGVPIEEGQSSSSGFYDGTDTWTEYMKAGDVCGGNPVGP